MSEKDPLEREMRERLEVLATCVASFSTRHGVELHFKDFSGYMLTHPLLGGMTSTYLFHGDPFCVHIKRHRDANDKCVITSNDMLMKRLAANHSARDSKPFRPSVSEGFYGTCWCGIREYVYPICHSGIVIGALLVGPFRAEAWKTRHSFMRLRDRYGFDTAELDRLYDQSLAAYNPDTSQPDAARGFETEVALIAKYFSMLAEYYIDRSLISSFGEACHGTLGNHRLITLAIEYISMNLSKKITVADMASYCMCSKSTLNHLFSGAMGMTIPEFISVQRVNRAKFLLANTDLSIEKIASRSGFSTGAYLSVVFKRLTDLTPSEYRSKTVSAGENITGVL